MSSESKNDTVVEARKNRQYCDLDFIRWKAGFLVKPQFLLPKTSKAVAADGVSSGWQH